MKYLWILLILSLSEICLGSREEKKLVDTLLKKYNSYVRPVASPQQTLKVQFGFAMLEMLELDEENGQSKVRAWTSMSWKDSSLTWSPDDYGGVDKLVLPLKKLWHPDIELFNCISDGNTDGKDRTAVVYSSGKIMMVIPNMFKVTCKHIFRGNSWTCFFKFGSWSYNGMELDMEPFNAEQTDIDMTDYQSSVNWQVLSHEGKREVTKYECCPEPYISMNYTLKVRSIIGHSLLGRRK